jgi:hypothetical protein
LSSDLVWASPHTPPPPCVRTSVRACVYAYMRIYTGTQNTHQTTNRAYFRFKRVLGAQTYICPLNTIKANTAQINAIFGGVLAYCLYVYICAYNMLYLPYIAIYKLHGYIYTPLPYISAYGQKYAFSIYIRYARTFWHIEKYLHVFFFVNIFYQIANFYFAYFQCVMLYFKNRAKKNSDFCCVFRIFSVPLHSETSNKRFRSFIDKLTQTQRYSVKMYPI